MSEAAMRLDEEELQEGEELQDVVVLDDASAEMLMQRIREADIQYERMEAWYEMQKDKARRMRDRTRAWAENCLRAYFDMVPTHDTKTRRVYDLPSGQMILKAREPEYDRGDESELVAWLKKDKDLKGLIKVKESSNWKELKKKLQISPDGTSMMTADGEIVPGIKVTQREPEFTVTVK